MGCRRTSRRCRRAETGAGPSPGLGPRAATRRALTIDPAFFAASHRSKHKERASESYRRKPQWPRLYSELERPHGSRARLEGDLCAGIAGTARPSCAAARLCVPQLLEGELCDEMVRVWRALCRERRSSTCLLEYSGWVVRSRASAALRPPSRLCCRCRVVDRGWCVSGHCARLGRCHIIVGARAIAP